MAVGMQSLSTAARLVSRFVKVAVPKQEEVLYFGKEYDARPGERVAGWRGVQVLPWQISYSHNIEWGGCREVPSNTFEQHPIEIWFR